MKQFKDWKISSKIMSIVLFIAILFLGGVQFYFVPMIGDKLLEMKQEKVKNVVQVVESYAKDLQKSVQNGLITDDVARNEFIQRVKTLRFDGKNYFWINDQQPKMIMHPRNSKLDGTDLSDYKDPNGKFLFVDMAKVCREKGEGFVDYFWNKPGSSELIPKLSYVRSIDGWGWIVGAGIYIDDVQKEVSSIRAKIFVVVLLILALSILVAYYINKKITGSLAYLNLTTKKISDGDYNQTVDVTSRDEIGELSVAFNKMTLDVRNAMNIANEQKELAGKSALEAEEMKNIVQKEKEYLHESVNNILSVIDKFAYGDLTVELEVKSRDEIGQLYDAFNKSVHNIRDIISNVTEAVLATSSASSQISSSTEQMAAGAQEQTMQTNEIAGAIEEMTGTIVENTRSASLAVEKAKLAGDKARVGGKIVDDTIIGMNKINDVVLKSASTIEELGKSSNQIGEIIQVIDEIADQTNLLALNAAIEAARAGEQGRGFAVVADEVRKLAERTSKATKEIGVMITKIQSDTLNAVESMKLGTNEVKNGKELSEKAGVALKEIITEAENVANIVLQVAQASNEQSKASDDISRNIEAITNVTQETASGIGQIAKATEDLSRLTNNLENLIKRFKV